MLPFTVIDCALLLAEWGNADHEGDVFCLACLGERPPGKTLYPKGHQAGCLMDQALAERGFPTQESRDHARERLQSARRPTEAPPPPPSTVPPPEGAPPE